MVAHQWDIHLRYNGPSDLMDDPHRKCKLCGKIQNQVTEYNFMRVVSKKWRPLVGRCEGVKRE